MGNATVGGDDRHPVAAARDQDRAQAVPGNEVAASDNDGVVGLQALPRSKPELGAVGRQHRGAGITREVAALGIDHHRPRGALGRLYQLPHQFGRKHALGVIREHDHVAGREGVPGEAKETLGRALGDRVGRLRIGAQELLAAGNEAGLLGGNAPPLHQQVGLDPLLAPDQAGEPAPHLVVPDHREQSRLRAERDEIAHHIAGAAEHVDIVVGTEDRHRRLGRGALDPPIDEPVQHHVANAGDPAQAERFDESSEGGRVGHDPGVSASSRKTGRTVQDYGPKTSRQVSRYAPLGAGREVNHIPQSAGARVVIPRAFPRDARLPTRIRARRGRAVRAAVRPGPPHVPRLAGGRPRLPGP